MASIITRPQSNVAPWNGMEWDIFITDVQLINLQICESIMSIRTKILEEYIQQLVESMQWRIKKAKRDQNWYYQGVANKVDSYCVYKVH